MVFSIGATAVAAQAPSAYASDLDFFGRDAAKRDPEHVAHYQACGRHWPTTGKFETFHLPGADYVATLRFRLTPDELRSLRCLEDKYQAEYLEIDFRLFGFSTPKGWEDYRVVGTNLPGGLHDVAFGDEANEAAPAVTSVFVNQLSAGIEYYASLAWDAPLNPSDGVPGVSIQWVPSYYASFVGPFDQSVSCAVVGSLSSNTAWCIFGRTRVFLSNGYFPDQLPFDGLQVFTFSPSGITRSHGNLPNFQPDTILRAPSGTSWLIGSDGYRRWIPTGGDYLCFVARGSQVVNLSQMSIDTIPDRAGDHATCAPGNAPQPVVTTPPPLTPDALNGYMYRAEHATRVNLIAKQPDGSFKAFWVGGDTVLNCLQLVQGKQLNIVSAAVAGAIESRLTVVNDPAACTFPPNWVVSGPGGVEQWRIEGDNSSQPYLRRHYLSDLAVYLNTGGRPGYHVLSSASAINAVQEGPHMDLPDGVYFVNDGNGDEFKVESGVFRKVPLPDMNACLGASPSAIIHVPANKVGPIAQGPPMACDYEGKMLLHPNGVTVDYVKDGVRHHVQNAAVRDCLRGRVNAGNPVAVSQQQWDSYGVGPDAYCPYELELGLKFITEAGSGGWVWLVETDGSLRHAGSLCVADQFTTRWKQFRVWQVPAGEAAGHRIGPDYFASDAACDSYPKIWLG